MKIKSGSPRRPTRAGKAQKAEGAKAKGGVEFSGLIEDEPLDTEKEAHKLRSQLLEELGDLAKEVEEGKTTKEEASRQFVGMVIKDRYGEQSGKGAETMQESIADMVEDDPEFVSRLHSQLKKLAKS